MEGARGRDIPVTERMGNFGTGFPLGCSGPSLSRSWTAASPSRACSSPSSRKALANPARRSSGRLQERAAIAPSVYPSSCLQQDLRAQVTMGERKLCHPATGDRSRTRSCRPGSFGPTTYFQPFPCLDGLPPTLLPSRLARFLNYHQGISEPVGLTTSAAIGNTLARQLPSASQQIRFGWLKSLQAAQHAVVDVQLRLIRWPAAIVGQLGAC